VTIAGSVLFRPNQVPEQVADVIGGTVAALRT
jgi:hypothetical protein